MYKDRHAGYVPRATRPGISADTMLAGHRDSRTIFSSITSTVLFKVKEETRSGVYISTPWRPQLPPTSTCPTQVTLRHGLRKARQCTYDACLSRRPVQGPCIKRGLISLGVSCVAGERSNAIESSQAAVSVSRMAPHLFASTLRRRRSAA
jgi:hypothetical protein